MNKVLKFTFVLLFSTTIFSCQSESEKKTKGCENHDSFNSHLIMAVLYHQKAAEYKALSYQAYNTAKIILDNDLSDKTLKGKRAVIVDIDETVLDNSPFEAKMITKNAKFPDDWFEWTKLASANPLPGSVEFLNYAASKNVEVFYITNRSLEEKDATIKNLNFHKFPMADTAHVITKIDESSKEKRRNKISENYRIVLLIGDNLTDFAGIYDKTTIERRNFATDSLKDVFGKKFILLPNTMYGDWENALYDYNKSLGIREKEKIRNSHLVDY